MAVTLETIARNAACNAVVDLCDGGTGAGALEFKTSGGTSTKGNGQVCDMAFNNPAFGAAATGVATMATGTAVEDTNADGGTTTKAYWYDGDDAPILTCSVGTSGEDINLTSVIIAATETVTITSMTYTVPAS